LELAFAIAAVIGATGLLFGLDVAERRRGFAVLALIGARGREISGFLWSEAVVVVVTGFVMGGLTGLAVAYVLVKELQGVFDPPPEALALPWPYLAILTLCGALAAMAVVVVASRQLQVPRVEALR
jgi:putative ABC transport system permease protein